MNLILASASPRRKEILEGLGVQFRVFVAGVDEHSDETDPARLTEALSLCKARAVWKRLSESGELTPDTVVLASDTVVASCGQILGKPRDRADAERMLRGLSGKEHEVISGIALLRGEDVLVTHDVTSVMFDEIPEELLTQYLDSGEPYDKAGAYAIQGTASAWIRGIRGDYFNVVGLPVYRLCRAYRELIGEELTKKAEH